MGEEATTANHRLVKQAYPALNENAAKPALAVVLSLTLSPPHTRMSESLRTNERHT
jgi:hypothetical protein